MSEISKLDHNLIIKKIDSETVNFQITDNDTLMSIVGQFDQNLKDLAKLTSTNIFFRGNSITCKGNEENINVLSKFEVLELLRSGKLAMISGDQEKNKPALVRSEP